MINSASRRLFLQLSFVGCLFATLSVQAATLYDQTIKGVGVQGNFYYVHFDVQAPPTCANGVFYIDGAFKTIYAQLLAAKLSGKRMYRVDYNQAGTQCMVNLVELRD